jgi:hypothetical protein
MHTSLSETAIVDYIEKYDLRSLLEGTKTDLTRNSIGEYSQKGARVFPPDWRDLVRLHRTVIQRKVITVLEFGVGYSTLVLAHALELNRQQYKDYVLAEFHRSNAFEVHSIDTRERYIKIAKERIPKSLRERVRFHSTEVVMGTWLDKVCTYYAKLPNIIPDLIYMDGPDPTASISSVRNFTTAHLDRLPMAADLLAIEHFLMPGTLILIDGRTANARFLNLNFQKRWSYHHDIDGDVHYLECIDQPLGRLNKNYLDWVRGSRPLPQ